MFRFFYVHTRIKLVTNASTQQNNSNVKACYNCNTTGHLKKNCPKPLRSWGSCYRCGSTQHRANNCSLNAASTSRAAGTTTLNLIQPNSPRDAFEVPISWEVSGGKYGNQQVNLTEMLDSESPNRNDLQNQK
ncbi:uncharacterized protein LOC143264823 [Megachile rotundata]|uniref:uncharacterized protein LOC143264823 n=1 Tax=Megachile rotundata TaxID=143995 RepID=UPI003FCF493C